MIVGERYKNKFINKWNQWLKVTFRGYNYGNIIANELSSLYHYDDSSLSNFNTKYLRFGVKKFISLLLFLDKKKQFEVKEITNEPGSTKTIHFLTEDDGRADYQKQCDYVINQLTGYNLKVYAVNKKTKPKRVFSLPNLFSKLNLLFCIFRNIGLSSMFEHHNWRKNIFILSKCLVYHDVLLYVDEKRLLAEGALLIVFADMKEYGNIMVQAAKKHDITTATLQHAIYLKRGDHDFSQSAINYLNSQADYVLGWGETAIAVYVDPETDNNKVILAGTSDETYLINKFYKAKPEKKIVSNFSVLFGGQLSIKSNQNMLTIAEALATKKGYKYAVLMHPTNKATDYPFQDCKAMTEAVSGGNNLTRLIDQADFCLCHSTTVYFQVLLNHKQCFRYNDEVFVDYGGLNDTFSDLSELIKHVDTLDEAKGDEVEKHIESLLISHFGKPTFSYKESIDQILSAKTS